MVKKVLSILLLLSLFLSLNITVASAAGGITKTATAETDYCTEGGTKTCTSTSTKVDVHGFSKITCQSCGTYNTWEYEHLSCTSCGVQVFTHGWCNTCGYENSHTQSHGTITVTCSHGQTSSHSYNTGYYVNSAYGYRGYYSTFTVYPISVVANNGFSGTVSVSGCTATDAAMSGKSVTVKVTGVSAGTKLKIVNSGTGATITPTISSKSYSYTFTMPATATIITIGLPQTTQTLSASLSSTTVGYGSKPTLTITGAKTTLSHASSNTSVASIDTSGNITLNGLGSTTFTITAAESSDYYSASTTVTLTVVKGNLSMKAAPTCSSINYGQVLSASTLSGGSMVNESSTVVDGTWSWKTPTAVPNAGKFAFVATYKPVDTAHYNY